MMQSYDDEEYVHEKIRKKKVKYHIDEINPEFERRKKKKHKQQRFNKHYGL